MLITKHRMTNKDYIINYVASKQQLQTRIPPTTNDIFTRVVKFKNHTAVLPIRKEVTKYLRNF